MVLVTRLNGTKLYINAELIQSIEETPDTVITLVNDKKFVVREKASDVVEGFIDYHHKVKAALPVNSAT